MPSGPGKGVPRRYARLVPDGRTADDGTMSSFAQAQRARHSQASLSPSLLALSVAVTAATAGYLARRRYQGPAVIGLPVEHGLYVRLSLR